MKKNLPILSAFCIAITFCLISCQKDNEAPRPLSSQIIGKWIMKEAIGNYTNYGVNRKDTTWFTSAEYFDFHADGTIVIEFEGDTYTGTWKITNNKLFLSDTHFMDYSHGYDLTILTNTDLQLYYTETHPDIYLEQKLNFHR